MGGMAGHLSHLHEQFELSFADIKTIFKQAASGKLTGTTKLDGQNLYLSFSAKRGVAVAARNKSDIKFGGATKQQYSERYKDKDAVKNAFVDAMEAFERTAKTFPKSQQVEIFGQDADTYFNCEVIDPRNPNVIKYDIPTVSIHRTAAVKYNKLTNEVEFLNDVENIKKIEAALQQFGNKPDGNSFQIKMDAVQTLKELSDKTALNKALSDLTKIQKDSGLSDSDTIGDYVFSYLQRKLTEKLPSAPQNTIKLLIKKIVGIKGYDTKTIVSTINDPRLIQKIEVIIQNSNRIMAEAVEPVEIIIHDFSVEMLKGLESVLILDPQKEVKRIQTEVSKAISIIQSSGVETAVDTLSSQLKKLQKVENISSAVEGFVFFYNGQPYKFTGNFTPVNRLLGLFKYDKGTIPALSSREPVNNKLEGSTGKINVVMESLNKGRKFALIAGSFKPPHRGHLSMIQQLVKDVDRVILFISPLARPLPNNKGEITAEQSIKVWKIYLTSIGLENKVELKVSNINSPIAAVCRFLQNSEKDPNQAMPGDTILIEFSQKGKDQEKYSYINNFIKEKVNSQITVRQVPIDPDVDENLNSINASDMRQAVADEDIPTLERFFPPQIKSKVEIIRTLIPTYKVVQKENNISSMLESLIQENLNEIIQKRGSEWCLFSKSKDEKGERKNLGCYPNKSGVEKRERQVQYFKNLEEDIQTLDNSLQVDRMKLPQVSSDTVGQLRDYLSQNGISTFEKQVQISSLKPTQEAIDVDKVDELVHNSSPSLRKPLLISNDYFIIDGHHRWAALDSLNPESIVRTIMINLPVKEAIISINKFYKTTHAGLEKDEKDTNT